MGSVEVKMLPKGVGAVFNSAGVVGKLEQMGDAIKNEANSKMVGLFPGNRFPEEHFTAERYRTTHGNTGIQVKTNTYLSRVAQAKYSTLTQSLDAGRS